MRILLFILLLLISTVAGAEVEKERRVEIYPILSIDPVLVSELVETILSEDSRVVAIPGQSRVLVMATEDEHRQAAELINQLNVPLRNVFIEVRYESEQSERSRGVEIQPRGEVVIRRGTLGGWFNADVRVHDERSDLRDTTVQSLLVSSGREGRIRVGESVPYLEWFLTHGRRLGYLHSQTAWRDVGAFLVVQPTIMGDGSTVRMRIVPELTGYTDEGRQSIRFIQVATDVSVRNGETVRIGGMDSDQDFYSRFLIGFRSSGETSRLQVLLTPTIQ